MDEFWNSENIKKLKCSAWALLGSRRLAHALDHFWYMKTSFSSTKPSSDLRWETHILRMHRALCVTVSRESHPPAMPAYIEHGPVHNFKPLPDKCLHMFDLLVLSCMLCSSNKQDVKWHFLEEWKIPLFLRCGAWKHMEKPAISPQRQWQETPSGPEGTEKSLRKHRKFLSQLNVSVNAKTCSKQRKSFIRHFYC